MYNIDVNKERVQEYKRGVLQQFDNILIALLREFSLEGPTYKVEHLKIFSLVFVKITLTTE